METIESYIKALPVEHQSDVKDFVQFMYTHFPDLNSKISYTIPVFLVGKKFKEGYIGISAASKHYSIHFGNDEAIIELKEKLPKFKYGKRCINIPYHSQDIYLVHAFIFDYLATLM